jgi:hypothetical protein
MTVSFTLLGTSTHSTHQTRRKRINTSSQQMHVQEVVCWYQLINCTVCLICVQLLCSFIL